MMAIEEDTTAEEQLRKKQKGRLPGAKNRIPAKGSSKRTYTKEQADRKNELRRQRRVVEKTAKVTDLQKV